MRSLGARPVRAGLVSVALMSVLTVAAPAQADSAAPTPRPPQACKASPPADDDVRQRADETKLAASVGLTVTQLDRGLRAAKSAVLRGDIEAGIESFATAAGTSRAVARQVLTPIERSVREDGKAAPKAARPQGKESAPQGKESAPQGKRSGTEKTSQRGAPVFDRAAIEHFAALLGVSSQAARQAIGRLTGASDGRVDAASALFAQVAADLGVSVQQLDTATRGLKTWLAERDGSTDPGGKRGGRCDKPLPATADS